MNWKATIRKAISSLNIGLRMNRLLEFFKADRFNVISWGATVLLVIALLGSSLWWTRVGSDPLASQLEPTAKPDQNLPTITLPTPVTSLVTSLSIPRELQLKTNLPADRPRLEPTTYTTQQGDALSLIAKKFNLKMESILYSSKGVIPYDNPDALAPGMKLTIPPVDGLIYKWQDNDTIQKVADEFDAKPDDIINFPGNNIDLTNPQIKPGTVITIPGGKRQLTDWTTLMPTQGRVNNGSTGTSDFGSNSCGGGPVDNTFGWPANNHSISGNDYSPSHLGIDIAANQGDPIYAAAAGIVTMAQGGDNYGYGNVIQIDHGNGFVTLYAHLSQINVSVCQIVGQGAVIGLAGATGNAFGAHLHFEIRIGGKNVNPHDYVQ
jgi:murein DD-endopeptidase MepM/ murein hydrolase activator NlpD